MIPVYCSDAFALMRNTMINKLVKFGFKQKAPPHKQTNQIKRKKLNTV